MKMGEEYKLDVKEIVFENLDWIHLAKDSMVQ
jgi:hypothetical protein